MIVLDSVRKVFPGIKGGEPIPALDDVSAKIEPGEFVTVIGPSGSGKSTLLFTIGAMMQPTVGDVVVSGARIYEMPASQRAVLRQCHFGFVFQTFNLLPYLSCRDNVALPAVLNGTPRAEAIERADSILLQLGLADRRWHRPAEISVGERQRVALGRSLVNRPAVLLADEPTGNLDPEMTDQVTHLLCEINREGQTVVLVTHDVRLGELGTRIIELRAGRIAADRPV